MESEIDKIWDQDLPPSFEAAERKKLLDHITKLQAELRVAKANAMVVSLQAIRSISERSTRMLDEFVRHSEMLLDELRDQVPK